MKQFYEQVKDEAARDNAKWGNPGTPERGYECVCRCWGAGRGGGPAAQGMGVIQGPRRNKSGGRGTRTILPQPSQPRHGLLPARRQLTTEQLPIRKSQLYGIYSVNGAIPLIPGEWPCGAWTPNCWPSWDPCPAGTRCKVG